MKSLTPTTRQTTSHRRWIRGGEEARQRRRREAEKATRRTLGGRYTDADGRRKCVYGSTRREVADKLARALASKDEPAKFMPTNITVAEFFTQYEDTAKHTMKRRSLETLHDIARLHILPEFGP